MIDGAGDALLAQFAATARDARRAWPRLGELLRKIEASRAWDGQSASFTEWMRDIAAPACGLREGSVWRYLRASRIYESLHQELAAMGHSIPPLALLSPRVSAESLELLDKLRRAAPGEMTIPIAERLLQGRVERDELRKLWMHYRPALLGRTAQGRGVAVPRIDPRIPEAEKSVAKADVLTALRFGRSDWTGAAEPYAYRVFIDVALPGEALVGKAEHRVIHAVALVRPTATAVVEFHAVHVSGCAAQDDLPRWLGTAAPYFTKIWVAYKGRNASRFSSEHVHDFGSLSVEDGQVIVRTQPRAMREAGTKTGLLATEILSSLSRRQR